MLPINPPTKAQQLKQYVIDLALQLLDDQEQEIESGIEDGLYSREDNKETLQLITEQRKQVKLYEKHRPILYVYLEGGMIQGASATENIIFNLFDKDIYDPQREIEEGEDRDQIPDEWDTMIKEMTANNIIGGIF